MKRKNCLLRYEEHNLCVAILYMLWYNVVEVIIMTTSIHCKVDAEVKKQAEAVFKEVGLNTSTAVNLFLKQAVIFKGIPFPIYTEKHNELNKLWTSSGGRSTEPGTGSFWAVSPSSPRSW